MRCELFDIEVERLTFFSTFTQRSLEEAERVEIAPAAELAPEHRELAEIAAAEVRGGPRPTSRSSLPVDRFGGTCSSLSPDDALVAIAAEEELPPALADHWQDVTTSFHDADAHHLYVAPEELEATLTGAHRAEPVEHLGRPAARLPRPGRRQRREVAQGGRARAREARALRLPDRGGLGAPRRGASAPATTWLGCGPSSSTVGPAPSEPGVTFATANLREGFLAPTLKLALLPRAPAAAPPPRPAAGGPAHRRGGDRLVHGPAQRRRRGARGPRHRALHRLRDEDRGRRDARLPGARVQGRRPRLRAERPAPQDQPLRGRGRGQPAALEARRQAVGADEATRPARRPGACRRADQPLRGARAAAPATRSRRTASGRSTSSRPSPTRRRPTSSTPSRP